MNRISAQVLWDSIQNARQSLTKTEGKHTNEKRLKMNTYLIYTYIFRNKHCYRYKTNVQKILWQWLKCQRMRNVCSRSSNIIIINDALRRCYARQIFKCSIDKMLLSAQFRTRHITIFCQFFFFFLLSRSPSLSHSPSHMLIFTWGHSSINLISVCQFEIHYEIYFIESHRVPVLSRTHSRLTA